MMGYIHEYVKGRGSRKDQNVGVLIGYRHGAKVIITASKANITNGDRFDKEIGKELALDRVSAIIKGRKNRIPRSIKPSLEAFEKRCKRYFKDVTKFETPIV
jgi:hypothetical protein